MQSAAAAGCSEDCSSSAVSTSGLLNSAASGADSAKQYHSAESQPEASAGKKGADKDSVHETILLWKKGVVKNECAE